MLAVALVSMVGSAANPAKACCTDIDSARPLGWASDGSLLVQRSESVGCIGDRTVERVVPGELTPTARFDLFQGGRELEPAEEARSLGDEELFEAIEEMDGRDPFPVPGWLSAQFFHPVTSLCGQHVLVQAIPNPTESSDIEPWDRTVHLEVAIWNGKRFVGVHPGLVVPQYVAETAEVLVHPAPNGESAMLRVSANGPDMMGDSLAWISLPPVPSVGTRPDGSTSDQSCDHRAQIIPRDDILGFGGSGAEPYRWIDGLSFRSDALSATDPEDAAELSTLSLIHLNRALWEQPAEPTLRKEVILGFEAVGYKEIAYALRGEDDAPNSRPGLMATSCRAGSGSEPLALMFPVGLVATGLGAFRRKRRD
ncbi:MAG: hypothetical protein AAGF12_09760 [Myxococcota bacterium]